MAINPNILTKAQQKQYFEGRCRHYHLYSEHPNCFKKEVLPNLREGYLDIETTGFEANYHHILTYVIKVKGEDKYYKASITKEDLDNGDFDKKVCEQLISDLNKFDVIYTYYGTGFDIPFMRARCLYWKLPFPGFGTIKHKDVYYIVRRLLKLNRKSLEVATRFLGISGKNHVLGNEWMLARIGNPKGLKYVMEHNIIDCDILEELHDRLSNYVKATLNTI